MTAADRLQDVIDKLDKEGVKPTLEAVRQAAGGGSYSTISTALRIWRERRKQAEHAAQSLTEIPEGVRDQAMQGTVFLWQAALAQAEQHFQVDRTKYLQQVEDAQRSESEALATADKLSQQVATAENQWLVAQEQCELEQKRAAKLQEDLDSLRQELVLSQQELSYIQTSNSQKEAELAMLRESTRALQQALALLTQGQQG